MRAPKRGKGARGRDAEEGKRPVHEGRDGDGGEDGSGDGEDGDGEALVDQELDVEEEGAGEEEEREHAVEDEALEVDLLDEAECPGWMPGAWAPMAIRHNKEATVRSMVPMVMGS
jgi:hypothetical protein